MEQIIPFRRDPHLRTQMLLPWYHRGLLDDGERAEVEAHLGGCADCAAELKAERMLADNLAELSAEGGADAGWSRLRRRLGAPQRTQAAHGPSWAAMAAAVLVAALLGAGGTLGLRALQTPRYQTLSAAPGHAEALLVVVFRPDTSEADFRRILTDAGVRLSDGPTEAGAYVLKTPRGRAVQALATLRRQPQVIIAQPLDAEPGP